MIILDVTKFNSVDQALKVYKQKHNKIGIVKELKERQEYKKPSVRKREQKAKAIHREKFNHEIR